MKHTKNLCRVLMIASLFFVFAAKGGTNGIYIRLTNNSSYDLMRGDNTLIPPRSREILIDYKRDIKTGLFAKKHIFAGAGFTVYKKKTNDVLGGTSITVSEKKGELEYKINSRSPKLKNLIDMRFIVIRHRGKYPDLVIEVSDV